MSLGLVVARRTVLVWLHCAKCKVWWRGIIPLTRSTLLIISSHVSIIAWTCLSYSDCQHPQICFELVHKPRWVNRHNPQFSFHCGFSHSLIASLYVIGHPNMLGCISLRMTLKPWLDLNEWENLCFCCNAISRVNPLATVHTDFVCFSFLTHLPNVTLEARLNPWFHLWYRRSRSRCNFSQYLFYNPDSYIPFWYCVVVLLLMIKYTFIPNYWV